MRAARVVQNKHLAYAYTLTSEGCAVVFYKVFLALFGLAPLLALRAGRGGQGAQGGMHPEIAIWKFRDAKICSYEQFHDPALAAAFR